MQYPVIQIESEREPLIIIDDPSQQQNSSSESVGMSESPLCACRDKILCVDDNEFNMMPLTLMIGESFGIECDEAHNG